MRELGLLHALSLAMKLCHPQEFASSVVASVQEVLFVSENEDWYSGYYRAATRNALTMVSMHYIHNLALIFTGFYSESVESSLYPLARNIHFNIYPPRTPVSPK
jgi:hypothetical protein